MKKQICVLAVVLAFVLLFSGCAVGNVIGVKKVVGDSELYSEAEIRSAMNVVIRRFAVEFGGCTLKELAYDEERTAKETEWNEENDESKDVIILTSTIYVGEGEGSLTPNTTYDGWSWELTRTDIGGWKLVNWGFG